MCDWAAGWRAPTQSPSRIKPIVKGKKKKKVGAGWRAEGNVGGEPQAIFHRSLVNMPHAAGCQGRKLWSG